MGRLSKLNSRVVFLLKFLLVSRSIDEDVARKEFLLNVLFFVAVVFSFFATVSAWISQLLVLYSGDKYTGISPFILLFVCLFCLGGYMFSRVGKVGWVSYLLLGVYFFGATYTAYRWGTNTPQALLIYSLLIVMSGILISSRLSIALTFLIGLVLGVLNYLQTMRIIAVNSYWRTKLPTYRDVIIYTITYSVIAVVSWLYNRELRKALERAHRSEEALRRQRDLLEERVEERTKALHETQKEKMVQLYRFAELGRLTAGLFHDLVDPLSLVSLTLERMNAQSKKKEMENIHILLKRARRGTQHLEHFVQSARKQMQHQEVYKSFSLTKEIKDVIQILSYKARTSRVKIVFQSPRDIKMFGNPIKFSQLITNLVLNAIDAYEGVGSEKISHQAIIRLEDMKRSVRLSVQDFGSGIAQEYVGKIFDPFFTTKSLEKGTGLGLSIALEIVRNDFGGKITVESDKNNGTLFTVLLPKRERSKSKRNVK